MITNDRGNFIHGHKDPFTIIPLFPPKGKRGNVRGFRKSSVFGFMKNHQPYK